MGDQKRERCSRVPGAESARGLEELRGSPGESWRRVPKKKIILVCHG